MVLVAGQSAAVAEDLVVFTDLRAVSKGCAFWQGGCVHDQRELFQAALVLHVGLYADQNRPFASDEDQHWRVSHRLQVGVVDRLHFRQRHYLQIGDKGLADYSLAGVAEGEALPLVAPGVDGVLPGDVVFEHV